ncbi:MAG: hypothetical protein M3069_23925, partial [Chloroflexota bacterium]|nr:hypothetical protein [Chloroflexota bacterium]
RKTFSAVSAAMADERSALLGRLEDALGGDERIVAAWIGGSIGRGEATDGGGGIVTRDAVSAVRGFVQLIAQAPSGIDP